MPYADSEGIRIYYDDRGEGEPVLLGLAMDWRGHGHSQASDRDFGFAENAVDALAVVEASGAQSVVPIAQG
jgi:hypothetical protein